MASTSWSSCSHSSMTCMPPARPRACRRAAISEYAPGQVEITLQHRFDALQAIDEGVRTSAWSGCGESPWVAGLLYGQAVRRSIRQRPAPARQPGRRRWQQSVRQRGPGRDPLLRQAIGGMKACLLESLALFCPNANSFRRFQANSYAPLAPTWGINNRTVSLRVPAARRPAGTSSTASAAPTPIPGGGGVARRCAWVFASDSTPVRRSLATATLKPQALPSDWLTALRALELGLGARGARRGFPEDLPGDQAGRIPCLHGRGRRAGLALVSQPGLNERLPALPVSREAGGRLAVGVFHAAQE